MGDVDGPLGAREVIFAATRAQLLLVTTVVQAVHSFCLYGRLLLRRDGTRQYETKRLVKMLVGGGSSTAIA